MTDIAPKVSVVICAYTEKRWDDIREAVQSLRDQVLNAEIVLVVDHNEALLERAQKQFDDIKVVPNHYERGLSGGRNTGVESSSGALIGFLDDDAVAAPDWVSRLAQVCQEPDILGASARVEPIWLGARPRWLPDEFLWVVGCSYRGLAAEKSEVRNAFGGAMLLTREALEGAGGFNTMLGRKGSFPLSCEETEFCVRARRVFENGKFILEPKAVIYHKIPAERLTWTYFRLRCFAEGISKAIVASASQEKGFMATERRYVLGALATGVMLGVRDALLLDVGGLQRAWAIVLGLSSASVGFAIGKLQMARDSIGKDRPMRFLRPQQKLAGKGESGA